MKKIMLIALLFITSNVFAQEHIVKMLNKSKDGKKMVFVPNFLQVQVGDTIKFVPTSKGHMAESLRPKDARPEGSKKFKGKLNKELVVNVTHEGIHLYKCTPHYNMGMIGMFVAGKPVNLEKIKKFKVRGKKNKRVLKELLLNFK